MFKKYQFGEYCTVVTPIYKVNFFKANIISGLSRSKGLIQVRVYTAGFQTAFNLWGYIGQINLRGKQAWNSLLGVAIWR